MVVLSEDASLVDHADKGLSQGGKANDSLQLKASTGEASVEPYNQATDLLKSKKSYESHLKALKASIGQN